MEVTRSGGTDTGVRAVEEQADNEQHGHSTSCCNKPKRQSSFGPARTPGDCRTTVGETVRDATVRKIGFLTAHEFVLSVEEVAGEQNSAGGDKQNAQIEAGSVQLDGKAVGIGIALHNGSAGEG